MLAERERLKAEYGRLYETVSEILFRHDPAEINFVHNTDEYGPEAQTILPRLRMCHSVNDVITVVHEELLRWFDRETAEPKERHKEIAQEIWHSFQKWQEESGMLSNTDN